MNIIDIARTIATLEIELLTTGTGSDNEAIKRELRDTERCISEAANHMKTMLKEIQVADQEEN